MTGPGGDPYEVLGITPGATDAEVRAAHRRLAQLHHPDHNAGSAESAQRFAAVQSAYTAILEQRRGAPAPASETPAGPNATAGGDPAVDARIAALERELQLQRDARARAQAAAREAVRAAQPAPVGPKRPTPEELGYFTTEDSLTHILEDAEAELAKRAREASRTPFAKRLTDLFGGPDRDTEL